MKSKKMTAGFTLVELIVVIAILGILAGVGTVGYSGYIKKANAAADQQLLSHLNTAFASACAANGESHYGRSDTSISLDGEEGAKEADVTVTGIADFSTSFGNFFEGGKFKTIEYLLYSPKTGGFAETTAENFALYVKLRDEFGGAIAVLASSNFGTMGAETLLTETASVVEWAANNGLIDMAGSYFKKALAGYLGLNEDASDEELGAATLALANNDETLAPQIGANAIALYAAQNTDGVTTETISAWLGGKKSTEDLQGNATGTTLSEAAAIYGLYMSWTESQGKEFNSNGNTLAVVTDALGSTEFAEWVESDEGEAELAAYKAAMSVISGTAEDEETRTTILLNGFDDSELIKLMESLMGN